MKREEVLRSIHEDYLEYIQKKVPVEYDNHRQRPVSFVYDGRTHQIDHALDRFRMVETQPVNTFLVRTDGGQVYCLVFQFHDVNGSRPIRAGCWVLSFRVLEDGELMAFKRVVEFHGRLCPDLVLGKKLCEYVLNRYASRGGLDGGCSMVAENITPALDAIQVMLGTTLG
ncbi:MAG: FmdE family protein, partial [Desulfobacteraceae bacterium]